MLVLVLVLGGGELGGVAWLGAFEGVLTVGDDRARFCLAGSGVVVWQELPTLFPYFLGGKVRKKIRTFRQDRFG